MKLSKIAGIALGGYLLYQAGKEQYEEFAIGFEDAIDKVKYDIKKVKNFDIQALANGELKFDMDLKIINPTQFDFTFNSGELIELKQIHIMNNAGQELATIDPGITEINLAPNDSMTLRNLPVNVPMNQMGVLVDTIINNFTVDKNQFALRLNVVVAGKEFEIDNQK
jgi:hypothetical protein